MGLSVSRVGGKAQAPALRKVSGRVRLDYAQFQELEMFTRFGGIQNARVKGQIARGERIRGLLTQPRFSGLRLVDQVALLAALADGVFDTVPVGRMAQLRRRLPARLDSDAADAVAALSKSRALTDEARAALVAVVSRLAEEGREREAVAT